MADSPIRPSADDAWTDLLHQLRRQPAAQPRPFFYSRVQARLAAKTSVQPDWLPAWLRRHAYAALLSVLVLSLNGDGPGLRARGVVGSWPGPSARLVPR